MTSPIACAILYFLDLSIILQLLYSLANIKYDVLKSNKLQGTADKLHVSL